MRASTVVVVLLALSCGLIFLGFDAQLAGIRIRAFDLGLLAVAPIFLFYAVMKGVRGGSHALLWVFGTYALYVAGNAALQTSLGTGIKEGIQFLLFAMFFLAFVQYVDTREATERFLRIFLIVLGILALWNMAYHLQSGMLSGWKRLGDSKLTYSVILTVTTVLLFSSLPPRKGGWLLLSLVVFVLVVLSGERKGWIAAAPAILAAALISEKGGLRRRAIERTAVVVLTAVALVVPFILVSPHIPYLDKQIGSVGNVASTILSAGADRWSGLAPTESNLGRIMALDFAIDQFRLSPLFGIGPDNLIRLAVARGLEDIKDGAHNELVRVAAETGILGLFLYFSVQAVVLGRLVGLCRLMGRLDEAGRLRARLAMALFVYGFIVNLFLAGGGLNMYFLMLPAALAYSVPLPRRAHPERRGPMSSPVPA